MLKLQEVSLAVARLMPNIIRGVQLDFFIKRRVTQTQLLLMLAVHAYSRCSMGTLSRSLHVSLPTVSGIVDRLSRAGYVRRLPHPSDRRQVLVELTAKGQMFIKDFQGIIRHRWEEVLRPLSAAERQAFYHIVTKLRTHLEAPSS
ncbi:MAG: MarR family transcriptional regulator [Candidatus Omnitrophica bacterium]|nr:MarR family transcriptional regulator [Candidatus Omnitrophota bacterium]